MTIHKLSQSSLEYRQEHLLLNLLRESDTAASQEELQAARLQLKGPFYRAAIVLVRPLPEEELTRNRKPPEVSEYVTILQKSFKDRTCYIVEYMERNCFILVFSDTSNDSDACSAFLQKSASILKENGLDCFIYVGNAYSTLDLLRQSFHEAKTAVINRNGQKESSIYFYGVHPSNDTMYQQAYPTADLDALYNAIDLD